MTTVSYAQWNGSLLQLNLFTQPTTLVLSAFGTTSTGQLTDQSGTLYVGETVIMAGKEYTYLGSGTAQPGVNVLGATVATGTKKDLLLLQDASGKVFFVYPDGVPNALGMVALVVDVDQVGYNLTTKSPICFAEGTLILTDRGEVAVETIQPGDRIIDHRGRAMRVLWRGAMDYGMAAERFHPVEIDAGALGPGRPARALRVSQQHRIAIDPGSIGLAGDDAMVLLPARALVNGTSIRIVHADRPLRYHHILCRRHSLCQAEGLLAETLLLGPMAIQSLSRQDRDQIFDLSGGRLDVDAALPGTSCKTLCRSLTPGDLRRARETAGGNILPLSPALHACRES